MAKSTSNCTPMMARSGPHKKAMAELFAVKPSAINKHIKNIYGEQKMSAKATISKMKIVQNEGAHEVK